MQLLESFVQDLRQCGRFFANNPLFSAIAVVSIAFGTGANVAIFSAADAILLRPLPVAHPNELVTVGSAEKRGVATVRVVSYPDYVDLRDRAHSFDGLIAFTSRTAAITSRPGAPPRLRTLTMVSGNFFRVLGVEPAIGRGFTPDEDRVPGRDAVVVLSDGLWQDQFGGDPAVIGRTVRIAGIGFTVVGVTPAAFTGIDTRLHNGAYVPIAMWPRLIIPPGIDPLSSRGFRFVNVKGRLKPDVTMAAAQAELATIAANLAQAYPDTDKEQVLAAQTELEQRFARNPLDSMLVVLLTILSVAVLCVACANVAGLLSSRAPVRAREIALRLSIGAGRPRLIRQLITESLGIAVAGAAGGLAVGYAGIILLQQIQFPTDVIAPPVMRLDERGLWFSILLAIGSTFLFGLAPAIQTTKVDVISALKSTDTASSSGRRLIGRSCLVAVQVALSLVLLTIAVYALQVFRRELTVGPGFRTSHLGKMTVDVSQAGYRDAAAAQFFSRTLEGVRALPGVLSASATSAMPLFSLEVASVVPEGFNLRASETSVSVCASSVDEQFFKTMAIPLVEGRSFRATDTLDQPRVAIVNDTFARHYWPGGAIGRRLRFGANGGPWVEVVGVSRTTQYWYPGEQPQDAVYFPFMQRPRGEMVILAESSGESSAVLAPMSDVVRNIDADVPVHEIHTIEHFYAARVTTLADVIVRLINAMGIMGVTLTMVGLYGLVAYSVSRRTREIGIRLALGASAGRVLRMILQQGLTPTLCGVAAGLVLSEATTRLLPRLVPISYRYDPRMFFVVVPLLLVVALLAAFVPARRAAHVDPTAALRYD